MINTIEALSQHQRRVWEGVEGRVDAQTSTEVALLWRNLAPHLKGFAAPLRHSLFHQACYH